MQQGAPAAGVAEQRIALDRVAGPGQVYPDLMAPAGDRPDREERVPGVTPYAHERGLRGVDAHVAEHLLVRHRPARTGLVEDDRRAVGRYPGPVLAAGAEREVDGAL